MLQEIVHHLLTPDVVGLSAAISSCEKGEQWDGVLGLLHGMLGQLLASDVMSCNSVISSSRKGEQ